MSDLQSVKFDRHDASLHGSTSPESASYPPSTSSRTLASRDPSITPTSMNSGYVTPITPYEANTFEATGIDNCSFDTETFPDESYLYPSDRNGRVRNEALHAIRHPRDAIANADWDALRRRLRDVAESTSEQFNASVNHAFDGYDLPAIHNRIYGAVPSVSMPNMRQLGPTIDKVSETASRLTERSQSAGSFLDQELEGDEWAFARIMNAEARRVLLRQKIREDWQLVPTQANLDWYNKLNEALGAFFIREKGAFGVTSLFSMKPHWVADYDRKVWCLELDTGFTNIVVDSESDEYVDVPLYLSVNFELPEIYGNLDIGDVEVID